MTTIDRSFVDGVFWCMLAMGAVLALITAVVIDLRFGYSLALGALIGATSLRATAAAVARLIAGIVDGTGTNALWGMALVLKLIALFVAVFVALVFLNAHAVAFVIGFKTILPSLAWQAIRNPGHLKEPVDDADDTESS